MILFSFQDILDQMPGEMYMSLLVVFIIFVISLAVFIKVKKADPLAKPKGLLHLAEIGVETFDNLVEKQMGPLFRGMGGYIMAIAMFIFISFIFGLTGLPSPMGYYMVPFTLALFTFIMIHATSIRYKKWRYFHRFIEPFAPFLPINLLSMWAPLISLSFRMFCNSLAGWAIMKILYFALGNISAKIFFFLPTWAASGQFGFNSIFIAPWITAWLHLYFDLFSAFIQTLVFITLTMILVAQEAPSEDELLAQANLAAQ